jgi:hypothetical protein
VQARKELIAKIVGNQGKAQSGLGSVSGENFGWRKKMVMWPWQVGPARQRGEGKNAYHFGILLDGPWAETLAGLDGCSEPVSIFSLLFSSFSVFFLFLHNYYKFGPD